MAPLKIQLLNSKKKKFFPKKRKEYDSKITQKGNKVEFYKNPRRIPQKSRSDPPDRKIKIK